MQLNLSAGTNVFIMNAIRNNIAFEPLTSFYILDLEDPQAKVTRSFLLEDQSPYPQIHQAFTLDLTDELNASVEHVYRLYGSSGSTIEDRVEPLLMSGYAKIHGPSGAVITPDIQPPSIIAFE